MGTDYGFTGTDRGMTDAQKRQLRRVLINGLKGPAPHRFHHGMCVGADDQADAIAKEVGWTTVGHPGYRQGKGEDDTEMRGLRIPDVVLPVKECLARNRDIVDAVQRMVATPRTKEEERRSGTWSTVRYAAKQGRPCGIIAPEGEELAYHQ